VRDDQAMAVLALLCAAFPSAPLPEATVELWVTKLTRKDAEVSMQAADLCIDTKPKFPSVAEFAEVYAGLFRSAQERKEVALKAIGLPEAQRCVPAEHLHLWRAVMGQPPVPNCTCESCDQVRTVLARNPEVQSA
jgi:hypothetical protein